MLKGEAEAALLNVPDALLALDRWPGQLKVLGPISTTQQVAVAFRPGSPQLRAAFDSYLAAIRADGTHDRLVRRYYPALVAFFPGFFDRTAAR